MTGIAMAIYESDAGRRRTRAPSAAPRRTWRSSCDGAEELEGTYPFTLARSVKAYRINSYLHPLVQPDFRERFLADPEVDVRRGRATAEERDMIAPARLARA